MLSPQIPVAKEGYPFIGFAAFTTVVFATLSCDTLAVLCFALTTFILCFFRDPERFVPPSEDLMVSPADGKPGLRVQDLKLTRGDAEREFNLRLVLVQAMKHDRKVSGDVALTVDGSEDGEAKSYALTDLLPAEADKAWPFSFRYFQDFDRQLVLPDGFTP